MEHEVHHESQEHHEHAAHPKKDRFLAISIMVAAVIIGGTIVFATLYKGGGSGTGAAAGDPPPVVQNTAVMQGTPRDVVQGNTNAPVTVIEYGDYQCPYCGIFFSTIESKLKSDYIDTGKVKFIFRDFSFLGPESNVAGAAAECALDQGKFWEYHDALYTAEIADGKENSGNLTSTLFMTLAKNVGLNTADFKTCIDSNKYVATVQQETSAGQTNGVASTPTTFVNGYEVTTVVQGQRVSVGADATSIFAAIDAALK